MTATRETSLPHREVLKVLSGLLLAMFVAMLSSTVVANALPVIAVDLDAHGSGYTWVVVATLLTMTASTPLWGKFADLTDKKRLVQLSLAIFVAGSVGAGAAGNMGVLIASRAVQGLGIGGINSLVQVVLACLVSPRERGRYVGYLQGTFAVATIAGPLLGGLIVDTLGWRWTFWLGVPLALAASAVLHRTLHLEVVRREVVVDYLGATLITGAVSALLVWVSLGGTEFDWGAPVSVLLGASAVILLVAALFAEAHAREPIIPLRLFRNRTTALTVVASTLVGLTLFAATVFLPQYFQVSEGMSPSAAGLMQVGLVAGLSSAGLVVGRRISRHGRWKRYLVAGLCAITAGTGLLATVDAHTSRELVLFATVVIGVGLGASMLNLMLAVQNVTAAQDLGAATSMLAFFRSLGGAIGVAALGAVFTHGVADGGAAGHSAASAYGSATGLVFAATVPLCVLALLAVVLIPEIPLRRADA